MLSMVSSSQSVGTTAPSTADLNSSSSSVSMNAGASVARVIASLAHSGSSSPQESDCQFYDALRLQDPLDQSQEDQDTLNETMYRHDHPSVSAASKAAAVLTAVSRAGRLTAATTAPKKRSTKSKCSPGLRSGKWTSEEEDFTNMIIHFFKRGLLDVEDGTSLRWYLAKRLNCEAMRVTKKLKGNSSIGKQVFRAVENNFENRRVIRLVREELAVVESRFLESLNAGGIVPGMQHIAMAPLPSSLAVSVRGRKMLPNIKHSDGPHQLKVALMPQLKSEDARLLIHFFSEAHDTNSDEEPEAEKKTEPEAEPSSLSIDVSDKLGKKRRLSSETTASKHSNNRKSRRPTIEATQFSN